MRVSGRAGSEIVIKGKARRVEHAFSKTNYEAKHKYEESQEYQIMVKAVDLFENDTNNMVMVE